MLDFDEVVKLTEAGIKNKEDALKTIFNAVSNKIDTVITAAAKNGCREATFALTPRMCNGCDCKKEVLINEILKQYRQFNCVQQTNIRAEWDLMFNSDIIFGFSW